MLAGDVASPVDRRDAQSTGCTRSASFRLYEEVPENCGRFRAAARWTRVTTRRVETVEKGETLDRDAHD